MSQPFALTSLRHSTALPLDSTVRDARLQVASWIADNAAVGRRSIFLEVDPISLFEQQRRFLKRTHRRQIDVCWMWTGSLNNLGYGVFKLFGASMSAQRASYFLFRNPRIPFGLEVCHRCDVPGCVNPAHLFLGTHRDNMMDAYRKGRMPGTFLTPEQRLEAVELRTRGLSYAKIGARYGVSHTAIQNVVKLAAKAQIAT